MKNQEVMCPHCGKVLLIELPDNSQIVGISKKDSNDRWINRFYGDEKDYNQNLYIKHGTHDSPFNIKCQKGFYVLIKHGTP